MESQPLESRVAKMEGQLATLVTNVKDFIAASETWRNEVSRDFKTVARDQRPNHSVLAVWTGVILTIIGMAAAPTTYFFTREMSRQDKSIENLDIKLQREATLMVENTTSAIKNVGEATTAAIKNLNEISKERHEAVVKDVDEAKERQRDRDKEDRQELMQRRLKESSLSDEQLRSAIRSEIMRQRAPVSDTDGGKNYER